MPTAPPTRRRWFQFGIGTMFVVVTAACLTAAQPLYVYEYKEWFMGDWTHCFSNEVRTIPSPKGSQWIIVGAPRLNLWIFAPAAVSAAYVLLKLFRIHRSSRSAAAIASRSG